MTKEELLKPRWKVIADFPCNTGHGVGEIISKFIYKSEPDCYFITIELDGTAFGICPDDYPHLFERLKWWEEREEKDLPKYLKWKRNQKIFEPYIIEKDSGIFYLENHENSDFPLGSTLPATEEEYLNQKHEQRT